MAHDFTRKVAPFLDPHLLWQILEFLQDKKVPRDQIAKAKIAVLSKTRMVDAILPETKYLPKKDDISAELEQKKAKIYEEYTALKDECAPLVKALSTEKGAKLKTNKDAPFSAIQKEFSDVESGQLGALYRYAKVSYDMGLYEKSASYLQDYRLLTRDDVPDPSHKDGSHKERNFMALWGKLGAEINIHDYEAAYKDFLELKDLIETRGGEAGLQLEQRSWLLHWGLFILFNLKDDNESIRNTLLDLYFADKYLNAIQFNCPHLLRYLTAGVIVGTKDMKELVKVLKQAADDKTLDEKDPLTELVLALHIEFDFKAVKSLLRTCEQVLKNDFFLSRVSTEFMEGARLLIFDTYCRIHHTIDIAVLADILGIKENIEQNLVEFIRQARVTAKIDSSKNQLLIIPKQVSVYQTVIGATKVLGHRSNQLAAIIERSTKDKLSD